MDNFSPIIVIGDCVATGTDVLLPEITGNPDCLGTDIADESVALTMAKEIHNWFLKNNKSKVHINDIADLSLTLKLQREKSLAWPSHIPNCVNLAVAGETFQGMHKKIKEHIKSKPKPALVLITDFSESHRCVVINHKSQKYVVKRDLNVLENKQKIWPKVVYDQFVKKAKQQENYGEEYQKRKHQKSFTMLTKLLDKENIQYEFLMFRKCNTYLTEKRHDFTKFPNWYSDSGGNHMCSRKLLAQEEIASYIKDTLLAR
jgi:hypothetical protein